MLSRNSSVVLLVVSMAGCVRPPVQVDYGAFEEVSVVDAQAGGRDGARVRWGGTIVTVLPEASETCFEVVNRPLGAAAEPRISDETDGRFLACAAGFYDPEVYQSERALTVVGTLDQPVTRKIGEYEYTYPMLRAETVYLWPVREPEPAYYSTGVYWGWPYYWWGPTYYPYPYYSYGYYGYGGHRGHGHYGHGHGWHGHRGDGHGGRGHGGRGHGGHGRGDGGGHGRGGGGGRGDGGGRGGRSGGGH
jgi:outer membrane lipoprotein